MYDVEKLVYIVFDVLDSEMEYRKYNLKVRKENGIRKDYTLYIPYLDASTAYRFGELSERYNRSTRILADICAMLDIDQGRLISAVKSIRRWESHNGRYDRDTMFPYCVSYHDKRQLFDYLKNR